MSGGGRTPDLVRRLRAATTARLDLGLSGAGLPTRPLLDFQMAHARARDAVHRPLPEADLLGLLPPDTLSVRSQASDRATFLKRPDLGRRLEPTSREALLARRGEGFDLAIVIADGLSATAVLRHGAPVALDLIAHLGGWRIAPLVIAHESRVALGDEIAECLGAQLCVILIGERPGLSADDSLGAYITWAPRVGRLDSERNCLSNIRPPHGLGYDEAVRKLAWLLTEAHHRQVTGVSLKDTGAEEALRAVTGD
ncbi:MAG: ethanolamine ammonia-lyase subunit EutC [Asticcacaulis sp.]|uniref:ethanolamine ammonia-lyase subunit EutC n=1 Tax=Asticcacaulis sp. TaxID=1872648 RepID=UPI0039E522DF